MVSAICHPTQGQAVKMALVVVDNVRAEAGDAVIAIADEMLEQPEDDDVEIDKLS